MGVAGPAGATDPPELVSGRRASSSPESASVVRCYRIPVSNRAITPLPGCQLGLRAYSTPGPGRRDAHYGRVMRCYPVYPRTNPADTWLKRDVSPPAGRWRCRGTRTMPGSCRDRAGTEQCRSGRYRPTPQWCQGHRRAVPAGMVPIWRRVRRRIQ